ncbi:type IX secretion system protein PorQ [Capnocytophaga sp. ARDL2]|uniref:type IX secretion system protein PorQ n=1 Tax=Capnocytophaga sp. ARDL2 TaxID=3238809 RepID=UPI0035563104
MKKIAIVAGMMLPQLMVSQSMDRNIYDFLNIPATPYQNALGGNNVTHTGSNPNQVLYNPASLSDDMSGVLQLSYGNLYGAVNMGAASYAHNFERDRNIQVGVIYLNYGSMDGYNEQGQKTQSFSASDIALTTGFSYRIQDSNFYVGANLKGISSTIEQYNSWAVAADIGGLYFNPDTGWNVGLTFRNIGFQLKSFENETENMPFIVIAGISKQLENVPIRWHLTLDNLQKYKIGFPNPNRSSVGLDGVVTEETIQWHDHLLRHIIIGAELFTNKKFNARVSYNFRRGEEMKILEQRSFAGLSFGFSLKLKKMTFDYSHGRVTRAGNSNFVGLTMKL